MSALGLKFRVRIDAGQHEYLYPGPEGLRLDQLPDSLSCFRIFRGESPGEPAKEIRCMERFSISAPSWPSSRIAQTLSQGVCRSKSPPANAKRPRLMGAGLWVRCPPGRGSRRRQTDLLPPKVSRSFSGLGTHRRPVESRNQEPQYPGYWLLSILFSESIYCLKKT